MGLFGRKKRRSAPQEPAPKSLIPSLEEELRLEMETDERIRDLEDILAERVSETMEEEKYYSSRDPDAILKDPRFREKKESLRERIAFWDGANGLTSLIGGILSAGLLAAAFFLTILSRGQASQLSSVLAIPGILGAVYGIIFGAVSVQKKERRRALGTAGFSIGCVSLLAFGMIILIGRI